MYVGALLIVILAREPGGGKAKGQGTNVQSSGEARIGIWEVLRLKPVLTVLFITFVLQLGHPMTQPVLPVFIQSMVGPGASVTAIIGTVFFVQSGVAAASAVAIGFLRSRVGVPTIVLICNAASGLPLMSLAGVSNIAQLIVVIALNAAFSGGLQTNSTVLLSSAAPARAIGLAFGLLQSIQAFTGSIGPVAGRALGAHVGARPVFVLAGALLVLGGVVVFVGLRAMRDAPAGGNPPRT